MDGSVDTYCAIGLAFFVNNGHYLAHIKHQSTGTWMLCDNNTVRQLQPSNVTTRRDGFPVNILFHRIRSSQQTPSIVHRSFENPTYTRCWMNAPLQTILNCLDYSQDAYKSMTSDFGRYLAQCQEHRRYNNSQEAIDLLSHFSLGYRNLREGWHDCRKVFEALSDGINPDVSRHFAFIQEVETTFNSPCLHQSSPRNVEEIMFNTGTHMAEGQTFFQYIQHCLTGVKKVSASHRCITCYPTRAEAVSAKALGSTTLTRYHSGSPPFLAINNNLFTNVGVAPHRVDPSQQLSIRSVACLLQSLILSLNRPSDGTTDHIYEIVGIVFFVSGNHFIAQLRTPNNNWLLADDGNITAVNLSEVGHHGSSHIAILVFRRLQV